MRADTSRSVLHTHTHIYIYIYILYYIYIYYIYIYIYIYIGIIFYKQKTLRKLHGTELGSFTHVTDHPVLNLFVFFGFRGNKSLVASERQTNRINIFTLFLLFIFHTIIFHSILKSNKMQLKLKVH